MSEHLREPCRLHGVLTVSVVVLVRPGLLSWPFAAVVVVVVAVEAVVVDENSGNILMGTFLLSTPDITDAHSCSPTQAEFFCRSTRGPVWSGPNVLPWNP